MKRLFLLTALMLLMSSVYAQVDRASVRFVLSTGAVDVDPGFCDNAEQLLRLDSLMSDYKQVALGDRYLVIRSYASPEGAEAVNKQLAEARGRNLQNLIINRYGAYGMHTVFDPIVYEWANVLNAVRADANVPSRGKVIETLEKVISEKLSGRKVPNRIVVSRIRNIDKGAAYRYIQNNIFSKMRSVIVETRYVNHKKNNVRVEGISVLPKIEERKEYVPESDLLQQQKAQEDILLKKQEAERLKAAEEAARLKAVEEARLQAEAEARAKAEAEAKALAEQKAKEEAEAKAKAEAEAKAKALAEQKAREEAEAKALAEKKALEEAEAKAKAEAEAKAKALAEQKAREEAEAKALAEKKALEAAVALKAAEEAARIAAEEARLKAEAEARAKAEAEVKAKEEAKAKAEAEAKAKAEEEARLKVLEEVRDTIKEDSVIVVQDTISVPQNVAEVNIQKPFIQKECQDSVAKLQRSDSGFPFHRFALKTNLLYDLAWVPNIALEFAITDHWSVAADWNYAWWSQDFRNHYWRTYGGNIEARYYLNNKNGRLLTGHHFGAYAGILTYDVEWGGKGYMGEKWSKVFGLSYGYSAPIGSRLHLDFEIGIGYFGGEYYEYSPQGDKYFWEQTKNRRWFGPTRAEVTLVWMLGKDVKKD